MVIVIEFLIISIRMFNKFNYKYLICTFIVESIVEFQLMQSDFFLVYKYNYDVQIFNIWLLWAFGSPSAMLNFAPSINHLNL